MRHPAYSLRCCDPGPGAWRLSFDASSMLGGPGWYAEWAWVLRGRHFELSGYGPVISDSGGNVSAEWEALVAGLDFLAKGRLGGLQGLRITGDERVVIGQLHGVMKTRLDIHADWRAVALDLLAMIGKPWSAVKVSREENRTADAIAGGGW